MLLKFDHMSRPVQLAQGLKVLPHLMRVFAGWPYREVPKSGAADALLNVLHEDGSYSLEAPWLKGRLRYADAAELSQGLASQVARGWMLENPGLLWLEAAAAAFGDQIVVFVGGPRSGKSLLTASLAVGGNRAFADSILPVSPDDQCGLAMGLAPRLKLPLPDELSDPLRRAIEAATDSGSEKSGYLTGGEDLLASFGETARIRAFVMLDRSTGPASLVAASPGKLVKRLLLNSFGEGMTADALLTNIERVVGDAPCYRLAWSDPQEAVNALRARFAVWRSPAADEVSQAKSQPRKTSRRRSSGPKIPAGRLFRHRSGLFEHLVDSDLFLVNPGGQTIYHLNGLGAGLWRLLDGTHGLDDAVTVLKEAFPEVEHKTIETDVKTLVEDLADRGLLIERVS